ncbi:GRAM domain containing 1B isoform X2 [Haematobia irritans]|uniref:GRAM domain containing 1B isoform X2 n=1 Tax=Haematobia irritans TaxID=7368 RepID=UPI003F4F7BEE
MKKLECSTTKSYTKIQETTSTNCDNLVCHLPGDLSLKKTNIPNKFTTPQNCFELLTCTSNTAISEAADLSQTPTLQSLKTSSPEDSAIEIKSDPNRLTSSSKGFHDTSDSVYKIEWNKFHFNSFTDSSYDTRSFDFSNKLSFNSENASCCEEESLISSNDNSFDIGRGICQLDTPSRLEDKTRNVSRLSDRAKKKSWYNVLYPNYKSRSQEFKKLFKEIPADERLIVDYSCAFYRDLLIQGRLYISQNYVCFHANILGWETCLLIKWKEVTSITKEKTALVIPNAISICTLTENHFFSSFATRDKTFLILFRVWQNTLLNKPMPAQEFWQLVHSYYGDELGLTTDDEDYVDPTAIGDNSSSVSEFVSVIDTTPSTTTGSQDTASDIYIIQDFSNNSRSSNYSSTCGGAGTIYKSNREKTMKTNAKELTLISAKPEEGAASNPHTSSNNATTSNGVDCNADRASSITPAKESRHCSATIEGKRKIAKNSRTREESANKNVEALPTDISDSSDSEGTNIPFVATTECTSPHEGRQLVHTILPINIETLFNLLFSKSKFLLDFHALRKSTDLVFGDWVRNDEGQRTRTVNLTVQLAASVGPKTSKVTEFQAIRECSKQGELYSIDVNSVNAGIPYADSFSVLIHYCLVKTVDDHTMLSIHAQIKYKKSIWGVVKGFIEKNTWAGLEDFYGSLLQSLQNETCIPPAKGKGRRPRRGTAVQIRPLDDIPPLQTKPEPLEHFIGAVTSRSNAEVTTVVLDTSNKYRWLSLFVLVLLCFLIIVNVILLLKLWKLEDRLEEDMLNRARLPNLSALKKLPSNHEDWIELMRQQELLHETEMRKWHTVLQTAIELLKKTEKTLAELMFR